ncbi:MAG TPA: flippase [Candidatus Bathyarchaeia archaeon]|nr:flippase [Candidatus Bathyarchaeia archaeon]
MDLSRRVTLNTLIQIVGRGGVILISLFTTAILTRSLGQTGYGSFSMINMSVVIFFSLADWGTNLVAVRESAKTTGNLGQIYGNCLLLRTIMALLGMFLYAFFVVVNFRFADFRREALIASLIIIFFSLKTSAQIVFHSKLKLYLVTLIDLVAALLFLFSLILFKGNSSLTLKYIVIFLNLSSGLAALLALFLSQRLMKANFKIDFGLIKYLVRESLPMGALLTTFAVYNRIDTFILQAVSGEAAVGLYSLAYKIHDNLILGAAYLMNAFFPVIANFTELKVDGIDLKRILQKAFDLLLAMAIPMTILFFILSPVIIRLLGGEEFMLSSKILRVLIFATMIAYLNHLTGYSLLALGEQRTHLKFCLVTLAVNVCLNCLLIPKFSYMGAAFVTVLTEGLIFGLTFTYLKRKINTRFSLTGFPKTVWQLIIHKGKIF